MILVTRLNGAVFALNPDLVERADCTPDTVVTLVDGTKYVIAESVPEFVELVLAYRATVIAASQRVTGGGAPAPPAEPDTAETARPPAHAKVVPLHRRDR